MRGGLEVPDEREVFKNTSERAGGGVAVTGVENEGIPLLLPIWERDKTKQTTFTCRKPKETK